MKRFLSVLMAAVMCISLFGTAFAATPSPGHSSGGGGGGNVTVKPSEPGTGQGTDSGAGQNTKPDLIIPVIKPSEKPGEEKPGEEKPGEEKPGEVIPGEEGTGTGTEDWIIGTIVDQNGNETDLGYEEHKNDIIITPAETADESTKISSGLKSNIKEAYNKLANNVTNLVNVSGLDQKVKEATNGKKTAEDLVVTNVFNVSTEGTALQGQLQQEGAGLRLNLNVGAQEDSFTAVMVYRDGEWVELENTVVNDDGTVTCLLQEGDTVAIVKEGQTESGKFFDRVVNTVKNAVKSAAKKLFSLF